MLSRIGITNRQRANHAVGSGISKSKHFMSSKLMRMLWILWDLLILSVTVWKPLLDTFSPKNSTNINPIRTTLITTIKTIICVVAKKLINCSIVYSVHESVKIYNDVLCSHAFPTLYIYTKSGCYTDLIHSDVTNLFHLCFQTQQPAQCLLLLLVLQLNHAKQNALSKIMLPAMNCTEVRLLPEALE